MAELIMTEEERRIPITSWDDESLGRVIKGASLILYEQGDPPKVPGFAKVNALAAGSALINEAVINNSDETTVEIRGLTRDNVSLGDWKIVISRLEESK